MSAAAGFEVRTHVGVSGRQDRARRISRTGSRSRVARRAWRHGTHRSGNLSGASQISRDEGRDRTYLLRGERQSRRSEESRFRANRLARGRFASRIEFPSRRPGSDRKDRERLASFAENLGARAAREPPGREVLRVLKMPTYFLGASAGGAEGTKRLRSVGS